LTTPTNRLLLPKPGGSEFVDEVAHIGIAYDKIDDNFIPCCKLRASVVQSFADGTPITVGFNVTLFDTYAARGEGPMADLTNDRIIIRKDGIYIFEGSLLFDPDAIGFRGLRPVINGVGQYEDFEVGHPNHFGSVGFCKPYNLTAGDLLTMIGIQNAGHALDTELLFVDSISMSATWVGKKAT